MSKEVIVYYDSKSGDIKRVFQAGIDPKLNLGDGEAYLETAVEDPNYFAYKVSLKTKKLTPKKETTPSVTWDYIRNERNLLLAATDWTQVGDNELTEEQQKEIRTYRMALRRLPQTYRSPEDVVFPDLPAFINLAN